MARVAGQLARDRAAGDDQLGAGHGGQRVQRSGRPAVAGQAGHDHQQPWPAVPAGGRPVGLENVGVHAGRHDPDGGLGDAEPGQREAFRRRADQHRPGAAGQGQLEPGPPGARAGPVLHGQRVERLHLRQVELPAAGLRRHSGRPGMRVHHVGGVVPPPGGELVGQLPDAQRGQVPGGAVLASPVLASIGPASTVLGRMVLGPAAGAAGGPARRGRPDVQLLEHGARAQLAAPCPGRRSRAAAVGRPGHAGVHRDLGAQPGQGGGQGAEAGRRASRVGILRGSQRVAVVGDQGDSHAVMVLRLARWGFNRVSLPARPAGKRPATLRRPRAGRCRRPSRG